MDWLKTRNKFKYFYPDEGEFSRDKYPRHTDFFRAGFLHNERLLLGGNRSGKTIAGLYETTLHLTGLYPDWWEGKRFYEPTSGWAIADTSKTGRDIIQQGLLGPYGRPDQEGTGMLPEDAIKRTTTKLGLADAVETIFVKHYPTDSVSQVQIKSRDQGREAFQGTAMHFIWCDEEPDADVYLECLMRTMTTKGILYTTATPLSGLTPFILSFLPEMAPISDKPEAEEVRV